MFGAGSDTTASAISVSVMAAATHPEAQEKVAQELETVIGRGRGECPDALELRDMVADDPT